MAESWVARYKREVAEIEAAVREALARPLDAKALRDALEQLAQKPHFDAFFWLWGPAVYERDRVLFRPFVLGRFSTWAVNAKGDAIDPWNRVPTELARWLAKVDAADDVELTRRLNQWRLAHVPHKDRDRWRDELVRRFRAATSPADRLLVLGKLDPGWAQLDAKTARELFDIDAKAARQFILDHLPFFGFWGSDKRSAWAGLLAHTRGSDFHFELYRRVVEEKQWRADLRELAKTVTDAASLDRELERRHPVSALEHGAETFVELVQERGRDVVPYVLRHLRSVFPRSFGREAKGLHELLEIADARGWFDLWAAIMRTAATTKLFDRAVAELVASTKLDESAIRYRLVHIAGHGREANLPGISFAHVHPLTEETALALYKRFPDLVRGAFRMHVAPGWSDSYAKLVAAAIAARDEELVDYFASRVALHPGKTPVVDTLTVYYEALPDSAFVPRAANALSRMPAYAVWNYDNLLENNRLARLLFERSTGLYLADGNAVRDLLESPQIHVQLLAFRILGKDDPRASAIGAACADLLQATLLRPLHRRTRLLAFRAIEVAARHDERTARYLVGRMKEALALPERRYPREKLIGLVAQVLHRWPVLRGPTEQPKIYGVAP